MVVFSAIYINYSLQIFITVPSANASTARSKIQVSACTGIVVSLLNNFLMLGMCKTLDLPC